MCASTLGEVVKTRPFTEAERQQDLPLDVPADESVANIGDFFGKPLESAVIEGVVVADGPPVKDEPAPKEPTEAAKVKAAKKALEKI